MKWQLRNGRIEIWDEDDQVFVDYCEGLRVSKVSTNLLDGKKTLLLHLNDSQTGECDIVLERGKVGRNIISVLYDYGLSLIDTIDEAAIIQQVIFESAEVAPQTFTHNVLGFRKIDNELVYLAHHPVGLSDAAKAASVYTFSERTEAKGTVESWLEFVNAEVIGNVNLELALTLGVTAPISYILRQKQVIQLCPIVALIGKSSTGKSSSLALSASVFGSPDETNGIVGDLKSTQNAFYASLENNSAFPVLIDETSAVPEWDFGKVLYNLPKGHSPRRCNGDGSLKKIQKFCGSVIFTGETSLFEQTAKTQGLHARLVEFTLPWTNSAQHADRIIAGCAQNHGTAVFPLAEWIIRNTDDLPRLFNEELSYFREKTVTTEGVEDRIFKTYAIIMVAAIALKNSLGLNINFEGIRTVLLNQYQDSLPEMDDIERVYQKILGRILANKEKFPYVGKENSRITPNRGYLGEISMYKGKKCVYIQEDIFVDYLERAGIKDLKTILKPFNERGWLVKYAERRYLTKRNLSIGQLKCYTLLIPDGDNIFDKLNECVTCNSPKIISQVIAEGSTEVVCNESLTGVVNDMLATDFTDKPRMGIAFAKPYPQGEAIVLNKELCKELHISTHVYMFPLPDENQLILSGRPIIENSLRVHLENSSLGKYNTNKKIFDFLTHHLALHFDYGRKIVFYAIALDNVRSTPTAVVFLNQDPNTGFADISTATEYPYEVPDLFKVSDIDVKGKTHNASQLSTLLADDDEDDEDSTKKEKITIKESNNTTKEKEEKEEKEEKDNIINRKKI